RRCTTRPRPASREEESFTFVPQCRAPLQYSAEAAWPINISFEPQPPVPALARAASRQRQPSEHEHGEREVPLVAREHGIGNVDDELVRAGRRRWPGQTANVDDVAWAPVAERLPL